ncbi:hypothetical protein SAMN02800692_3084 [Luteibacter sp. UNC138MFCol5.1]|uniref:hypothetical protein n=1 Tax=Luteibacter sp. UNC138MFCol5.1 TaxID=1502774 RepID=UPI0008CF5467|nr:hypothetical protein [Luteibacter sp. UNC138MFCol5.1]SEO99098.1 hypothetical protein SAMN02800692_3084 [Luteibacter sp. UNC138MFCol5.1]
MHSFLTRVIAVFEIAGGLFGLVHQFDRLLGSRVVGMDAIVAVLGVLLFGFILVAGVLLASNDGRGTSFSIWAQFLQAPLLATPFFSYALSSGAFANLSMTLQRSPRLGFDWSIAEHGWLLALAGPSAAHIGINLLALGSWLVLRFGR